MPKKVHGRPAKGKARPRRPASRPVNQGLSAPETMNGDESAGAAAVMAAPPPVTTPAARAGRAEARRAGPGPRKAPGIVVNYEYLRHDLRTLAILAPAMVVLLVIAFLFLH